MALVLDADRPEEVRAAREIAGRLAERGVQAEELHFSGLRRLLREPAWRGMPGLLLWTPERSERVSASLADPRSSSAQGWREVASSRRFALVATDPAWLSSGPEELAHLPRFDLNDPEQLEEVVASVRALSDGSDAGRAEPPPPAAAGGRVPVETLDAFQASLLVSRLVQQARRLAASRRSNLRYLSSRCLMAALLEDGRQRPDKADTPQWLWRRIEQQGLAERWLEAMAADFPDASATAGEDPQARERIASVATVTASVLAAFQVARRMSEATSRRATIHARHLLAALLIVESYGRRPYGVQRLAEVSGLEPGALLAELAGDVAAWEVGDDLEAWAEVASLQAAWPQAARRASTASREPLLAGFHTDAWEGEDLLGIREDVEALASLIAAWSVEPPLSIGLFGDWGSGKTFFMRKLRERVELLARAARASGRPQRELGYYKNIVQIEFNAWHYVEGNLWASLVEHIFANLRLHDDEPADEVEARRREVLQRMDLEKEARARAERRLQALRAERAQAEERVQAVRSRHVSVAGDLERLSAADAWSAADVPGAIARSARHELEQLGVPSERLESVAQVRAAWLEVRSLTGRIRALLGLRQDAGRAATALWTLAALGAAAGVPLLLAWIGSLLPLSAGEWIGAALGLLGSAATAGRGYAKRVGEHLAVLEQQDEKLRELRRRRLAALEGELADLRRQEMEAEQERVGAQARLESLRQHLEAGVASRLLEEFIQDRAGAEDYRKELGILALVRRDFERLSRLFAAQRQEERAGTERADAGTINRIVLYIDDLDRCPPERVVQVLQAIHLLLAFPLFVVVVGVDARWVTRSLERRYDWLLEDERDGSDGRPSASGGLARPHDYLEKIFQIPLWLRPIEETGCDALIDGLLVGAQGEGAAGASAESGAAPAGARPAQPEDGGRASRPAAAKDAPESGAAPKGAAAQPASSQDTTAEEPAVVGAVSAAPKSEVDLDPPQLALGEREVLRMKRLASLYGRSPRAVKRFVNCYRLLKASVPHERLDAFLGRDGGLPGFEGAMLLLALQVGAPNLARAALEGLQWGSPEISVEDWLRQLMEHAPERDLREGRRIDRYVKEEEGRALAAPLGSLRDEAARVARYAFQPRERRLDRPPADAAGCG